MEKIVKLVIHLSEHASMYLSAVCLQFENDVISVYQNLWFVGGCLSIYTEYRMIYVFNRYR